MSNQEFIYTRRMKLADILARDNNILSILQRLDIKLGFGEATVSDICSRYGISENLFLIICNIYSFRDYAPDVYSLHEEDITKIIDYLRVSHRFYTNVYFPVIHEKIHRLVAELDNMSRRLIDKFYDDYDCEVSKHFIYEEEIVYPYIDSLLRGCVTEKMKYNIKQFECNHSNINEKLNDLKNIITKYLGEDFSSKLRFELLNDIYLVESDLRRHSLIENKLLIPLVEKLEKSHEQRA